MCGCVQDAARLMTGCNDKIVRVFDLARPDAAPTVLAGHTSSLKRVLFLPGSATAVSGGDDGVLRVRCVHALDGVVHYL